MWLDAEQLGWHTTYADDLRLLTFDLRPILRPARAGANEAIPGRHTPMHRSIARFRAELAALLLLVLPSLAFAAPAAQPPAVQNGGWTHSEVDDWLPGTFSNTYVEGSVLRLQSGQTSGEFVSAPLQAPFGFNGAVASWQAAIAPGQTLELDVRPSVDGVTWGDWRPARVSAGRPGELRSQLWVFAPFTSWLQYRLRFGQPADVPDGSPTLDTLTLTYIASTAGPSLNEIVGRVPLVGPASLTPAPEVVSRTEWSGEPPDPAAARQRPNRVEVDQILAPADDANPLATLRALRWISQNLDGLSDLPYHLLIDGQGRVYEGSSGVARRAPGADAGVARVALLADADAEGVSEAAQAKLIEVLGWIAGGWKVRSAAMAAAPDAPERLRAVVEELRPAVDRAVVRTRVLFAEGRTQDAVERLVLYNPTSRDASATLSAYLPAGEERRSLVVPAGQRVDLTLNTALPPTTALGLELRADQELLAERTLVVGRELLGSTGASEPARSWYFAEGSTVSKTETLLQVLNPQRQEVAGTLTFFPDGGAPVSQSTSFAPRSRTTLRLNDLMPDMAFGFKLATVQPVVAERTTTLESGAAHLVVGASSLSRSWTFAEGSTTEGLNTTLHLLNPWKQQVGITLRVMSEDGTSLSRLYAVPAEARLVLPLDSVVPALPVAMQVEAERPLAAERVMLFDNGSIASASIGAPALAPRWTFVEGSTAAPAEQYLLLANPDRESATVRVDYKLANGAEENRSYTVPAMSRLTIYVNGDVAEAPIVTTVVTASRPIVAERSIFVSGANGRGAETSLGAPGR